MAEEGIFFCLVSVEYFHEKGIIKELNVVLLFVLDWRYL